jgi:hypothetical protein
MIDPFARGGVTNLAYDRAPVRGGSFAGVNTTRLDKFQAREQRRWGDWSYWRIPPPVLWLEEPYVLSPFDDILFVAPSYVDIWET